VIGIEMLPPYPNPSERGDSELSETRVLRICLAGVTGWQGVPLSEAVINAPDLHLSAGVARSAAGKQLRNGAPVYGDVESALEAVPVDVFIDYTAPNAVARHARTAIERGIHAVLGASGLTPRDFIELDALSRRHGVGVVAAANFSPLATLLGQAAAMVARHLSNWEIVEYAPAHKPDAPSATSQDLARRLSAVAVRAAPRPIADTVGDPSARGATVERGQVHSVRLPSYLATVEVILAATDDRIVLRYEPSGSPQPYIDGTLMAVRGVRSRVGLTRGLDAFLGEDVS
jgi:4-hydroxy-tetrahydrodipicolinate reductase